MYNDSVHVVVVTAPLAWAKRWAGENDAAQWLANHRLTGAAYVVTAEDKLVGCADADELVLVVNDLVLAMSGQRGAKNEYAKPLFSIDVPRRAAPKPSTRPLGYRASSIFLTLEAENSENSQRPSRPKLTDNSDETRYFNKLPAGQP